MAVSGLVASARRILYEFFMESWTGDFEHSTGIEILTSLMLKEKTEPIANPPIVIELV
jgi:hypothetical protein